jgi:hypothetical protein
MVSIVLITTIAYASLPLIASHSETRHTSITPLACILFNFAHTTYTDMNVSKNEFICIPNKSVTLDLCCNH